MIQIFANVEIFHDTLESNDDSILEDFLWVPILVVKRFLNLLKWILANSHLNMWMEMYFLFSNALI